MDEADLRRLVKECRTENARIRKEQEGRQAKLDAATRAGRKWVSKISWTLALKLDAIDGDTAKSAPSVARIAMEVRTGSARDSDRFWQEQLGITDPDADTIAAWLAGVRATCAEVRKAEEQSRMGSGNARTAER